MRDSRVPGGRFLSAVLRRALDPTKKLDYVIVTVFAALPTLLAVIVGNHVDRGPYRGLWNTPNWWSHSFLLPIALFFFRWAMTRIAPVTSATPPPELPGVVGLVKSEEGRALAYEALRDRILAPGNLVFAVIFMATFSAVDVWEKLEVYWGVSEGLAFTETAGWTVMFVTGEVNRWANLAHLAIGYSVQFVDLGIMVLFLVLMVRHNLFFMGRVYQRRKVAPSHAAQYIVIDLEDHDRCFGFRRANAAFNVQVACLWIAGSGLLFSRYQHIGADAESVYAALDLLLPFLGTGSRDGVTLAGLLPDFGQWIILLGWLGGLAIISMPVFVKLLPRIPFTGATGEQATIKGYLREFLPDSYWPFGDEPSTAQVNDLAARFAANAFWPTGNNRAKLLFNLAFFVGLLLLFPVLPRDDFVAQALVVYASMLALAWLGTRVWFWLLASSLTYIDPRLVEGPRGATPTEAPRAGDGLLLGDRFAGRVFISYRRSDAIAYAGRLQEALDRRCFPDRIFRDIEQIRGGTDFVDAIETALEESDFCLVLIGPHWLDAPDDDGERRLDDESDWVRLEVVGALQRDHVVVVPVLLGKAEMPSPEGLPEPLRPLARLHAIEISDSRWEYDVGVLVQAMSDSYEGPPGA